MFVMPLVKFSFISSVPRFTISSCLSCLCRKLMQRQLFCISCWEWAHYPSANVLSNALVAIDERLLAGIGLATGSLSHYCLTLSPKNQWVCASCRRTKDVAVSLRCIREFPFEDYVVKKHSVQSSLTPERDRKESCRQIIQFAKELNTDWDLSHVIHPRLRRLSENVPSGALVLLPTGNYFQRFI